MTSFNINEIHIMEQAWKDSSYVKLDIRNHKIYSANQTVNLVTILNDSFEFIEIHSKAEPEVFNHVKDKSSKSAIYPIHDLKTIDDYIKLVARSTKKCKNKSHRISK